MNSFQQRGTRGSFEWAYVVATIAAFVFVPEIRRLVDWHGNFDPLNTFSIVPLLMLCPVAILAFRRRSRLRSGPFGLILLIWSAAFTYAAFVALARGAVLAPLYDLAQFCLPIAVGVWLLTSDETMEITHARVARALLLFGFVASAYGIAQYILAPPWDTAWMQSIHATAFGTPERFGIRVFSVLNGPAIFGLFLACVVLFNLPYLRLRRWFTMLTMILMTIALMLSLFRTAWLAVGFGVIVFVLLSPDRIREAIRTATVVGVCVAGAFAVMLFSPDANASDKIIDRFATLTDVQDDYSLNERRATRDATLQKAFDKPVGAGLGSTGDSAALSGIDVESINDVPDQAIDNGFVSRLFEMGMPGFAALVIACCASIAATVRSYTRSAKRRNRSAMLVAASCIAVQAVLFAVNLSDDDLGGLLGVIFFAALAIPLLRAGEGIVPSANPKPVEVERSSTTVEAGGVYVS